MTLEEASKNQASALATNLARLSPASRLSILHHLIDELASYSDQTMEGLLDSIGQTLGRETTRLRLEEMKNPSL
jgi:hypothetical protein